ncbi:hypothetical protein A1D29_01010 [Pasteurellaceae bacterium Orientalotternb1]|nr:hypothetical protein A1D29_01010 [Pasteurellaceae bacterium Orientalotternb1]
MLYTFSQAHYEPNELQQVLAQISENDAVVLWQNGVLQAVRSAQFFANVPNVFVLENDVNARNLHIEIPTISLKQLVELTVIHHPHIAL